MQGIYATSNSTSFRFLNPFYRDPTSHMATPNNLTPKSTPAASVLVGPMSHNEQKAFLLVNAIRHSRKDQKDRDLKKLATLLQYNTHSSSFVSARLYTSQVPGEKLRAPQLNRLLRSELVANTASVPHQLIDLLFPSTHINDDLLRRLQWTKPDESGVKAPGVWAGNKFHDPPTNFTEQEIGNWMNNLARAIGGATGRKPRRWWSHHMRNTPPVGAGTQCKPDLILLDEPYLLRIQADPFTLTDWAFIRAIAETTAEEKTPQRMLDTVIDKGFLSLQCQPARRFAIALSFNGSGEMAFTLMDREGLLRIPEIQLMGGGSVAALVLLKILDALMFGTDANAGIDPYYEVDGVTGKVTAITVDNMRFEVEKMIYSLDSLVGRATRVWTVRYNGCLFVLKDCWIQVDRIESEEKFLAAISASPDNDAIKNSVPALLCGGDVIIDGIVDNTNRYRIGLVGVSKQRVHRRLVSSPVGEPISRFRTKKEFISALIDVIRAHDHLYNKLGILHRDVSLNNILLHRIDTLMTTGLLIDFDYSEFVEFDDTVSTPTTGICAPNPFSDAADCDASNDDSALSSLHFANSGIRTGTPPFMAIEALTCTEYFEHAARHDLESILYVIIYICTFTNGPNSPRTGNQLPKRLAIRSWFKNDGMTSIGTSKIGHMTYPELEILPGFTEYWSDFAPFVLELIKACFPSKANLPNSLTYKGMIDILSRAQDVVQETLPDKNSKSSQAVIGQKRQLPSIDHPRSKRGRRIGKHLD